MTDKKGNGHDPATRQIVEILERMERRFDALEQGQQALGASLGARIDKTNAELAALRKELHEFRDETRDELLDLHADTHEIKMTLKTSIEPRLLKLEAGAPPPEPPAARGLAAVAGEKARKA